jgi:hypothetical protein
MDSRRSVGCERPQRAATPVAVTARLLKRDHREHQQCTPHPRHRAQRNIHQHAGRNPHRRRLHLLRRRRSPISAVRHRLVIAHRARASQRSPTGAAVLTDLTCRLPPHHWGARQVLSSIRRTRRLDDCVPHPIVSSGCAGPHEHRRSDPGALPYRSGRSAIAQPAPHEADSEIASATGRATKTGDARTWRRSLPLPGLV